MEAHNAFSASLETSKSSKPEPTHPKKEKPATKPQPKSSKRKQRFVPLSLAVIEPSPPEDDELEETPESLMSPKQPPSPTIPLNPRSINLAEQLRECLEVWTRGYCL